MHRKASNRNSILDDATVVEAERQSVLRARDYKQHSVLWRGAEQRALASYPSPMLEPPRLAEMCRVWQFGTRFAAVCMIVGSKSSLLIRCCAGSVVIRSHFTSLKSVSHQSQVAVSLKHVGEKTATLGRTAELR